MSRININRILIEKGSDRVKALKDEILETLNSIDNYIPESLNDILLEANADVTGAYLEEAQPIIDEIIKAIKKFHESSVDDKLNCFTIKGFKILDGTSYNPNVYLRKWNLNNLAAYNVSTDSLIICILDKSSDLSEKILYGWLNEDGEFYEYFEGLLVHELTHYIDKSNNYIKKPKVTANLSDKKYANDYKEINAHTKEYISLMQKNFLKKCIDVPQELKKPINECFGKILTASINEVYNKNRKLNIWINLLYPRNKSHVYKEIVTYFKKYFTENYASVVDLLPAEYKPSIKKPVKRWFDNLD